MCARAIVGRSRMGETLSFHEPGAERRRNYRYKKKEYNYYHDYFILLLLSGLNSSCVCFVCSWTSYIYRFGRARVCVQQWLVCCYDICTMIATDSVGNQPTTHGRVCVCHSPLLSTRMKRPWGDDTDCDCTMYVLHAGSYYRSTPPPALVALLRHFKLSQIIRIIHGNEFLSSWIDHGNPRQCAMMMMWMMQDMM